MEGNSMVPSGVVSFVGALCIVFIVLKLTGHVTWSWLWILWLPLAVFLSFCTVVVAVSYVYFKAEGW